MDDQNSTIVLQIITGGPCCCRSPYHFRKPPHAQYACKSSKRNRAAGIPALRASLSLPAPLLDERRRGILRTYIHAYLPSSDRKTSQFLRRMQEATLNRGSGGRPKMAARAGGNDHVAWGRVQLDAPTTISTDLAVNDIYQVKLEYGVRRNYCVFFYTEFDCPSSLQNAKSIGGFPLVEMLGAYSADAEASPKPETTCKVGQACPTPRCQAGPAFARRSSCLSFLHCSSSGSHLVGDLTFVGG